MIAPEDYVIEIARGSSIEEILLKLEGKHPEWHSQSLEFLITENGKAYVSHVSSHAFMQSMQGVADQDVLSQGSMSVFNEGGKLRPVVRPKCCELSGTDFLREMERRIARFVLALNPSKKEVIWA